MWGQDQRDPLGFGSGTDPPCATAGPASARRSSAQMRRVTPAAARGPTTAAAEQGARAAYAASSAGRPRLVTRSLIAVAARLAYIVPIYGTFRRIPGLCGIRVPLIAHAHRSAFGSSDPTSRLPAGKVVK